MIPVEHGVPERGLIFWCRLSLNYKKNGWCGQGGRGWKVYLYPNHLSHLLAGDYKLLFGREGERPWPAADLYLKQDGAGRQLLEGRCGGAALVARRDGGQRKWPSVSLYWCVHAASWMAGGEPLEWENSYVVSPALHQTIGQGL